MFSYSSAKINKFSEIGNFGEKRMQITIILDNMC